MVLQGRASPLPVASGRFVAVAPPGSPCNPDASIQPTPCKFDAKCHG